MRVKVTVEKITLPNKKVTEYSSAVDMYVEGADLRFFSGPSSKLVVVQELGGGQFAQYNTDFAFSSAITALDAAATNGQWVLT
jgi:hypothetical protein